MSANSAAVNSPYPTRGSLAGRVHGAVEARSHVDTGPAGCNEDHLALAGGDEGRGIEEGGDPHLAGPSGTRSEAQFEDDMCAQSVPTTPWSVTRGDAGVSQCTRRAHEGDGSRIVLRQDTSLHRVVDADNGHAARRDAANDRSRAGFSHRRLSVHGAYSRTVAQQGAGEYLRRVRATVRPRPTGIGAD